MYDWRRTLLKQTDSIRQAVVVLEEQGLRIALVVDENRKLLGTVTDGDVRRALLNHILLDAPVSQIMHTQPFTAPVNEDKATILAIMEQQGLLQIPLVDSDHIVIGLETLQQLSQKKQYDNPVFLMAGGFGTRLQPLTHDTPKPMLRLGEKPILESIIKSFSAYGFRRFYIAVHYLAEKIINYFGDGSAWGVNIEYIHEFEPLGTAGALGLLPENMPDLPLIVMNGDILTKVNFEHLLRFHTDMEANSATMCVRRYDLQVPYGVVDATGYQVNSITEKPIHNFFVNAGIYVLEPSVLHHIQKAQYCDMPTLLESSISEGNTVSIFPIHEYWLDIGRKDDFGKAASEFELYFQT